MQPTGLLVCIEIMNFQEIHATPLFTLAGSKAGEVCFFRTRDLMRLSCFQSNVAFYLVVGQKAIAYGWLHCDRFEFRFLDEPVISL